jgi:drug/metabolite transporter (DMT)-like permease
VTPGRGRALGYFEALLAASLWGSSGVFATHLFALGVPPASVALLRPLVGLVFLTAATSIWRRDAFRISARSLLLLAGVGGAATALFQVAFQLSLDRVGVPVTVALLYLSPALVLAASGPLLGEWPSLARVGFALLSVAGVWLTALNARGAPGEVAMSDLRWGILAALSYASYSVFGRYASPRWGSLRTVLSSTAGSAAFLLVALRLASVQVVLPASARAWTLLVLFGLLTIAAATFLFYDALARVEAGPTAVACTVEPVVAALLASWLLGQGLGPPGWLGLALVVAGVAGAYGWERREAS